MNLKILITLVGLSFGIQKLVAQDELIANSIIVGGSLSFNNNVNTGLANLIPSTGFISTPFRDETKSLNFGFTPYIGKELNSHWLLGLDLNYQFENYLAEDAISLGGIGQFDTFDFRRKTTVVGIGAFSRYILNPTQQFKVYLRPFASYNFGTETESQDDIESQVEESNYFVIGVGAGVLYSINENWNAFVSFGSLHYLSGHREIRDTDNEVDYSAFIANVSLSSIRIGFEFKL